MYDKDERRSLTSTLKTSINIIIMIAVAVSFLLIGMFVLDGIGGGVQTDSAYWIQKFLSGAGSLMIMFACANVVEEALKKRSTQYHQRLTSLDEHYTLVMRNGETSALDMYLTNKNKRNKYRAWLRKYKFLLRIARDKRLKAYCEVKLLMPPDEVWDTVVPHVCYPKLTVDKLMSGAAQVSDRDEGSDIDVHRVRYMLQKMMWKAVFIVGFGCYVPDLVYHFSSFDKAMIIPLIFKLVVILWALYSGVSFGYQMQDRIMVVLKRKLIVFSEFRNRTDNAAENVFMEDIYAVEIEPDRVVEKLRLKMQEDQANSM